MGQFLHKYNTDNVHTRAVIVGLINLLNSRIQFENVLSDTVIETIGVPFLPNMGGDERFLQDFFTHWNDCKHPRMADGNYDVIPRGVVTLTSNTINTTAMTHRFVRGSYVKEVKGELQRYNAFLNSLPLTMDFDIEVETDTVIDAFKIQQAILETFYKVQVFSVSFKGFRVPCQAGFSDDLGIEKTFEFTYQDETEIKFKFSISVETYYPVTDPTTERLDSNRMVRIAPQSSEYQENPNGVQLTGSTADVSSSLVTGSNAIERSPNIEFKDGQVISRRLVIDQRSLNAESSGVGFRIAPSKERVNPPYYIELTSPTSEENFFSTGSMPLTWVNTGTITNVNLYYKIEGTDTWVPIVKKLRNTGFFEWVVPYFDASGNEVQTDDLTSKVISPSGLDARVRSIIGTGGGVETVVVFESGESYNNDDNIEVTISPRPFEPTPTVIPPLIQAEVNGSGSLIGANIVEPGAGFKPSVITKIMIKIEDVFNSSVYNILSKNGSFAGDIDNTTIIEDRSYINNINPTVHDLVDGGYLVIGLGVTGNGIPEDTIVDEIDIVNNRIKISNQVTSKESNAKFQLSQVDAVLNIK